MKNLKKFTTIAATVTAFLLYGTALAQSPAGVDVQNMDPKDYENLARQASSSPEQQAAAMAQFQNMDPQQQQAAIERFQNLDPQLQQDVMQQVQNVTPEMQQNAMQQAQGMNPPQMQDAMQQRMNGSLREQMGVTNDAEWAIIEGKINAVRKAQMASLSVSGIVEMMGLGGMGGGLRGGGGLQAMFGQPVPESASLRQAIDSDAPKAQIKILVAKLQAVRKEKLMNLARAQIELRAVLTIRREAVATMAGLLN